MKSLLVSIVAAVLLVGCGKVQQSPEALPTEPIADVPAQPSPPPVEAIPVEPIVEAAQPAQDAIANRALMDAARDGNIEAIKQQLAAGADVNAKDDEGLTSLDRFRNEETAALLYKHGAKRARDLKAESNRNLWINQPTPPLER